MIDSTGTRARGRIGAVVALVALIAASLVTVMGAAPAGAATPTQLKFTTQPGAGVAGSPLAAQPVVAIKDITDATVTTSTSQVYLRITPTTIDPVTEAGATLTCTSNPVAAVAGVATFAGCRIDRAGTYKLTAEDPADGIATESVSLTIVPGAATKLAFTTQPGYGTAGVDLTTQPKVSVQDAFGNTVTTGSWDITLAIQNNAGPAGVLACTPDNTETTDTTGSNPRTATFAGCDISIAGTGYTLGATSNPVLTAVESAPFNVSAASATRLAFTKQPSSGAPASALPIFDVAFVDAAGRIVSTNADTIDIDIAPSPPALGVLSGCSYGANTKGVVTVTGCEISLPGVGYRFRATATSGPALPVVDSDPFTVGILHLAFIAQPGNGVTGSPLSPQPIVAIEDADDQIVASTEAIGLNITPGTGGPTAVGAVLTCATNPLPAVDGIAAFALCKVDKPGVGYRITATSLTLGISVNSAPFNVVGPPSKLVFTTQPSDGVAGIPLATQPVVVIQDAAGQVVTADDSTVVTLAIAAGTPASGGPGTLTCAPRTAVDGVVKFTNCSINQIGAGYKLKATSNPALATATSDEFDITQLQRIFGPDAIDTSIEISRTAFPVNDSAGAVVLARSDFFSDALAGGPLAAVHSAPLLITPGASQRSTLDPRVLAEIQRVLTTGRVVYILGGVLALGSGIDAQLATLGYTPLRVAGPNLYSTAVAIAFQLGSPSTVFEATGLNFPDALSAVPAAIKTGGAILLTAGSTQAPETAAYLAAHPPTTRYAIGGPLAAAGADPSATPVYGQDLFDTSAAVASRFFATPNVFGIATGLNYPDALSGGVFMATGGRLGPVLLVSTHVPLPPSVATYLTALPFTPGYIFGGPIAVGLDVQAAIEALF